MRYAEPGKSGGCGADFLSLHEADTVISFANRGPPLPPRGCGRREGGSFAGTSVEMSVDVSDAPPSARLLAATLVLHPARPDAAVAANLSFTFG